MPNYDLSNNRNNGQPMTAVQAVMIDPATGLPVAPPSGASQEALESIDGKLPPTTLGQPTVARQLTSGAASTSVALTSTCTRVSLRQRNADARYRVGTGAQTAVATDHFIAADERLDIQVPAGATIAVLRDSTTDGILQISELL